jgi:surface antigen
MLNQFFHQHDQIHNKYIVLKYGHVAYVESVNSNGSVRVSEMNYGHGAGVVTSRTLMLETIDVI